MIGEPVTADGVEAGTWAVAEMGRSVTAAQYLAALEGLHASSRAIISWWEVDGFDLLLTPTLPEVPPLLGEFAATADDPLGGLDALCGVRALLRRRSTPPASPRSPCRWPARRPGSPSACSWWPPRPARTC